MTEPGSAAQHDFGDDPPPLREQILEAIESKVWEHKAFQAVGGPYEFSKMLDEFTGRGWLLVNAGLSGEWWFAVMQREVKDA